MAIRQLSVFIENKEGSLHQITEVLAKAGVDLRSMCLADTSDYGIARIITNDPDKAKAALADAGYVANIREITGFAVPDVPGGLASVLAILDGKDVNIEYMYALITGTAGKAYAVMRTDNTAHTEEVLKAAGVEILQEGHIV